MSDDGVQQAEAEVEAARARLSDRLSALKEPGLFSDLAETVKSAAAERKDEMIETARARATSMTEQMVEDLKAKAAANPAAVAVIGAGVAWHLLRKPPIVAALVGGGLLSLLRTPAPAGPRRDNAEHVAEARRRLKAQARGAAEVLGDAASTAGEKAGELFDAAKEAAVDKGRQAVDAVSRRSAALAADASEMLPDRFRRRHENGEPRDDMDEDLVDTDALPDEHRRAHFDGLMLGAAGVAVAAAAAIFFSRGSEEG